MEKKLYKIFSAKMAHELCVKGFRIVDTEGNTHKPWLNVFLFEDTPEFRTAMTKVNNDLKSIK